MDCTVLQGLFIAYLVKSLSIKLSQIPVIMQDFSLVMHGKKTVSVKNEKKKNYNVPFSTQGTNDLLPYTRQMWQIPHSARGRPTIS